MAVPEMRIITEFKGSPIDAGFKINIGAYEISVACLANGHSDIRVYTGKNFSRDVTKRFYARYESRGKFMEANAENLMLVIGAVLLKQGRLSTTW